MVDFSIIAVFFVGLLGGVHCIGMCGSIVGVFSAQIAGSEPRVGGKEINRAFSPESGRAMFFGGRWPFHLSYNSGRLASYMVAGALAGAFGQAGLFWRDTVPVQHLLFALSSVMLIALGLYLAGVWGMVRHIEQMGAVLWRYIQPLTKRLLPANTIPRALLFGMVWGWLPCGLVYSVLITALASGNPQNGALIMLAFGMGTLPNLLMIGLFWEKAKRYIQSPFARISAGLLVSGFGLYGLVKVGFVFYRYGWAESCHIAA